MSSLDEVARLAGVSKSVASRALTGDARARISSETRVRVRQAASAIGYVANQRSRALRLSRTGAIALIIPDVNNAVFASMLDGVQDAAREHESVVLLGEIDKEAGGRAYLDKVIKEGRADGILLQRPEDFDDDELRAVVGEGLPVVLINSSLPDRKGSVLLPDAMGAGLAVEYLIEAGHTKIGHLSGYQRHDTARRRQEGFREAISNAGLLTPANWIVEAGWEAAGGASAMRQLLKQPDRPTAVLVSSVNAAIGALGAAQRAGARVPQDLSIITINDTWVAEASVPSLTTVRMPLKELGFQAAQMLFSAVAHGELCNQTVTAPQPAVITRESVTSPENP